MPMRVRLFPVLCAGLAFISAASATEGMWQPRQVPEIATALREAGLAIEPSAMNTLSQYPANAIVSLGGCTASFVSPNGLVVTNHHCAYGAIQFNSTAERNLLERGFLATGASEEPPGDPALRVYVTEDIRDVTADIAAATTKAGTDGRATYDAIDRATRKLVRACEADGTHRCEVAVFHGGTEYNLIRQLEIRDVRLVYAPPEAIGKFGGDVDNWMWPRHTGDFAFLRAYVSRSGRPAPYHADNVPYRPKSWLKINAKGLAAGDFTMLMGYPGRTNRWRLAEELDDAISWQFPMTIETYSDLIAQIESASRGRPDAAVKYAAVLAGLRNTLKNYQGQLAGFARWGSVATKRAQEARMAAWLRAKNDTDTERAISDLRALLAQGRSTREGAWLFSLIAPNTTERSARFNREGSLVSAALDIYRTAVEGDRPDSQRELGYQDRDMARVKARLATFPRRFDAQVDRALLDYRVRRYAALPAASRVPEFDAWLGISGDRPDLSGVAAKLDAFYAGTKLADDATRMSWYAKPRQAIEASDDTALQLAVAIYPAIARFEGTWKAGVGTDEKLRPRYMHALIEFLRSEGRAVYPDANGTLRVTYGHVRGYSPADAVTYAPFTTLAGIAAKTTEKAPFNTPLAAREAIAAKRIGSYASAAIGDVPVNFLSDLDITGGNSGSPTLDKNGDLVGLAFDGNWESVASNWLFNPVVSRTIHVDVRYMLWVMDEVDHAERLIEEMGLTPASN
jgi:hypothetical protein